MGAVACVGEPGALDIPLFVVALVVMTVIIAALTVLAWTVQLLVFKPHAAGRSRWASVLLIAAAITSLVLGAIDVLVLPAYWPMFEKFGVELPDPTLILFSARHVLWLPALLLLLTRQAANRRFGHVRFAAAFLIGEIIVLALILWAFYLPIFKLGCM
jgi:hypothetical protein